METVEETKLRIIREAIQHNIEWTRGTKAKASARPKRLLPLWLLGSLLITSLAYLSVPSQVVSRGRASSPHTLEAESTEPPVPVEDQAPEVPRSVPRRLSRAVLPLGVKKIVLDPGHGGKQHGAISDSGVSEKEITLDIALRLRRLMQDASFEVMMTRQTDQTVPLDKRVAFATPTAQISLFQSMSTGWSLARSARWKRTTSAL